MDLDYDGYLMAHFTGESETGEQVYFAISRDGLHWQDLNQGEPVLISKIGEMGVRDPYIMRSSLDGRFYILATDLRIASGTSWENARALGSRKIILWRSDDLIHWSEPWCYEVPLDGAGSVWAPETCFDEQRQAYLVFWSSYTREPGDESARFRIFCSYTKDFVSFSLPQIYMEREKSIIDATIIHEGQYYYRFTKDEVTKGIILDRSNDLQGTFSPVSSASLERIAGVEGPLAFPAPDGKWWILMIDRFAEQLGYLPFMCEDLEKAEFHVLSPKDYHLGNTRKRHGSVIAITETEYLRLKTAF